MKQLSLLRHAKSSWKDWGLRDFDRPLNPRGVRAAKLIGKKLRKAKLVPDLILCSSAQRALETLDILLPILEKKSDPIEVKRLRSLYLASPSKLLAALSRQASEFDHILLIGHNPGLESLAERLCGPESLPSAKQQMSEKFPTAGFAHFQLSCGSWHGLEEGKGKLVEFWTPRGLEA